MTKRFWAVVYWTLWTIGWTLRIAMLGVIAFAFSLFLWWVWIDHWEVVKVIGGGVLIVAVGVMGGALWEYAKERKNDIR